ncbi:MAG: hypothetical protein JKY95_15565 [Planctomycetaceae bacterium]|nr:hypothetical protein [Planctomycetaceae bacterium]
MKVSAGKTLFTVGLIAISALAAQIYANVEKNVDVETPVRLNQADLFPVNLNAPKLLSHVSTGQIDSDGNPIQLSCQSCHSVRVPDPKNGSQGPLLSFHQDLDFVHGKLVCISCHNPEGSFSNFRLASGQSVEPENLMELCAQCHGPQFRDYQHGSHGGMTGYWDLTKGPRQRNHCIDCHDPHQPAFPQFRPAAGPKDRFPPHHEKGTHE